MLYYLCTMQSTNFAYTRQLLRGTDLVVTGHSLGRLYATALRQN